jgi:hypothetical protein
MLTVSTTLPCLYTCPACHGRYVVEDTEVYTERHVGGEETIALILGGAASPKLSLRCDVCLGRTTCVNIDTDSAGPSVDARPDCGGVEGGGDV